MQFWAQRSQLSNNERWKLEISYLMVRADWYADLQEGMGWRITCWNWYIPIGEEMKFAKSDAAVYQRLTWITFANALRYLFSSYFLFGVFLVFFYTTYISNLFQYLSGKNWGKSCTQSRGHCVSFQGEVLWYAYPTKVPNNALEASCTSLSQAHSRGAGRIDKRRGCWAERKRRKVTTNL